MTEDEDREEGENHAENHIGLCKQDAEKPGRRQGILDKNSVDNTFFI